MRRSPGRLIGLTREFAWVSMGQISAAVGTLVGLKVFTTELGPGQFGEFALGLTLLTLLSGTVFTGPGLASMRFFQVAMNTQEGTSFLSASWKLILDRSRYLVIALAACLPVLWYVNQSKWVFIVIAASLAAFLTALSTIIDGIQNAARQRRVVAIHNGLYPWLRVLVAWALFPIFGPSGLVAIWGYTIASGAILFSQALFFRLQNVSLFRGPDSKQPERVHEWSRQMNHYSWPVAVAGGLGWIQTSGERWALQTFADTSIVGLYAALAQIGAGIMVMLSNVAVQMVAPVLFSRVGDASDAERVSRVQRFNFHLVAGFLAATLMLVIIGFIWHGRIFSLMVAQDFQSVSWLLPVMFLGGGMLGCAHIATFTLFSGVDTRSLIAPRFGIAVLSLFLNVAGAKWYGLEGIVVASVIVSFVYFMWMLWIAPRGGRRSRYGRFGLLSERPSLSAGYVQEFKRVPCRPQPSCETHG